VRELSKREARLLLRVLAPPATLAEWFDSDRSTPFRLPPGPVTWMCMMRARAIQDARMVARVAPWRYFADIHR
jgi:hypothetical protein